MHMDCEELYAHYEGIDIYISVSACGCYVVLRLLLVINIVIVYIR